MINDVAGSALNKITMRHDMKKQWRANIGDVAYAADIVDWRAHGSGTDASLYDYVIFCINTEDMLGNGPAHSTQSAT
jgi:hypothetical protein